jgi:ADP-ribose pyrophosphatase YjhB (NUDIX family)
VIIMDTPKHSVSVAAVITDDQGRALLIQRRDNGHWEPPGGVLELDETIEDGLRREMREETGLEIEPGPLTGVYKNMNRAIVALVFRCTVTGGRLLTNDEAVAFRWADRNQVHELTDEAYRVRILDALAPETSTAVRHHDGTNLLYPLGEPASDVS